MLNLSEIQKFYPENLHKFKRFMLREYLQYKILEIIFDTSYADKLSFLGGTCLRIVYNNNRFSKDLDFDNFDLSENDFKRISDIIKNKLELQGYEIEIKNVFSGAFHCYIRFPKLLFDENISGHIDEKILIQLDTEAHSYKYTPKPFVVNKFDVFTSIKITPPEILLAQKFYALINRKRKKGRDFFDIIFLLKIYRPDYNYLKQKMDIDNPHDLKVRIFKELEKIQLKNMANDVRNFLFNPDDDKYILLFKDYINQIF